MSVLRRPGLFARWCIAWFAAASLAVLMTASAPAAQLKLHTDQQMIEELLEPNDLDIKNPNAVFAAVFDALPPKVTVYPTESYYYFTFPYKGVTYAGNIRFDAFDQFDGKVHFAYVIEYAYWRRPEEPIYKKLGPDDGVKVTQVNKLGYTIELNGKKVEFVLPDLSDVKPAPEQIRDDEVYLGPSWDESGVQFFLVFNKTAKAFLYILNEKLVADQYDNTDFSPALTVGKRTSFAFYKDKLLNRQILIGDFVGHTMLNDYFDGPFDQLPDNYTPGTAMRDAILQVEPGLAKENPDRYGADPTGEFRYGITSYKYYGHLDELKPIVDCASKESDPAVYYKCFDSTRVNEEEEQGEAGAKPSLPWDKDSPPAETKDGK